MDLDSMPKGSVNFNFRTFSPHIMAFVSLIMSISAYPPVLLQGLSGRYTRLRFPMSW
jgi:hypothetical protein